MSQPSAPAFSTGSGDEPGRVLPGRLKLDELLADVLERVQELQGQRQRLRVLLDDVVGIGAGLSLNETLHRITEAARELVDARYAALGVLAAGGGLQEFITSGLDQESADRIGHLPEGDGILGLLIDEPKALRLADLHQHPAASGFPPAHPPMGSFLGVPISIRGQVFGNLYLTEKMGAPEFDDDDEQLLSALAGAAGVAIDNARLYELAGLRQRWLRAGSEVTHRILALADEPGGSDTAGAQSVAEAAHRVANDDLVTIWMLVDRPTDGSPGSLLCRAACGDGGEILPGIALPAGSSLTHQVIADGRPRLVTDLDGEDSAWRPPSQVPAMGSALILPLVAQAGALGALVLARTPRRPPHAAEEIEMAQGFASQAALGLALARSHEERRRLAVFADRDRIARDLHDQVIQQIFASGLALQGLSLSLPSDSAAKVEHVVQNLDDTIGDLRRAIFSLRVPANDRPSLRSRVMEAVNQVATATVATPQVRLEGSLDSAVPAELADHAVAVVREGLSNAVRHADATMLAVSVALRDGTLTVTVDDDGRGLPDVPGRQSGLRNLRSRAEAHGGAMLAGPGPNGRGTRLRWEVPVR
ncbi:MAG TPA: GAF domain-containing protein [Frankiaceae bacterium]|nr:GAF domain-containing protein [Frankiaceae bacterium]